MKASFSELGQQPHEGDVVRHESVRCEVTETDGPRIVHVDIIMLPVAESTNGSGEAHDIDPHAHASSDLLGRDSIADMPPG